MQLQNEGALATTTPLGPSPARGKSQERQLSGRSFSRHEAIARYLPEGFEVGQAAVAPASASRGDGPISTFWCVCVCGLFVVAGGRAKREREEGRGGGRKRGHIVLTQDHMSTLNSTGTTAHACLSDLKDGPMTRLLVKGSQLRSSVCIDLA